MVVEEIRLDACVRRQSSRPREGWRRSRKEKVGNASEEAECGQVQFGSRRDIYAVSSDLIMLMVGMDAEVDWRISDGVGTE